MHSKALAGQVLTTSPDLTVHGGLHRKSSETGLISASEFVLANNSSNSNILRLYRDNGKGYGNCYSIY